MTDSLETRFQRLEGLDAARTSGKWCVGKVAGTPCIEAPDHKSLSKKYPKAHYTVARCSYTGRGNANAEFIAAAPEMLSLLRDYRAENTELRDEIKRWQEIFESRKPEFARVTK